jgi:hypothetical protein
MNVTKLERKILMRISQGTTDLIFNKHFDGCASRDLAESVFINGIESGYAITDSARAGLSRTMKGLKKKGLVKEVRILRSKYWDHEDKLMTRNITFGIRELNPETGNIEWNREDLSNPEVFDNVRSYTREELFGFKYVDMPMGAKRWWLLTDTGKQALMVHEPLS